MSVASQSIFHIVFSTFNQEDTITKNGQRILFKYVWEVLKKRNCELYRINGTANHLHLVIQLHYLVTLDALIKDIQQSTTTFIGESLLFPDFAGWQDGYCSFSHSFKEKDELIEYVKNQQEIHKSETYLAEKNRLISESGVK
ncbi:MAG: transposase [Salinivirgaceae bacterium]|nr:MAG: transposase [Salinivirgaceae bacterium]